jgi:hypothetical protein
MPRTERVRILIYRSVISRCLDVETAACLLPLELYLGYRRRALTNRESYYNPIYLTFLPIRARGELLLIRYY